MTEVKEAPKPKSANRKGPTKEIAPPTPTAPPKVMGSPFTFMRWFAAEMDRLFENFGLELGWPMPRMLTGGHELLRRGAGFVPAEWSPKVDVIEREGRFIVRADLPGLSKEDIQVEVTDDLLTIQGEREHEKTEGRDGYCYSECSYGSFYRAIPLPEGIDASKATADFRKGVLEVTVPSPSRPESKARRLEVREGK
jgi:HSP20 family protein